MRVWERFTSNLCVIFIALHEWNSFSQLLLLTTNGISVNGCSNYKRSPVHRFTISKYIAMFRWCTSVLTFFVCFIFLRSTNMRCYCGIYKAADFITKQKLWLKIENAAKFSTDDKSHTNHVYSSSNSGNV